MPLHAGTSSWSEKSWVGPFYPKGTQPGQFLTHYATRFKTVEADVTYYRIPDKKLVDGWNDKTPDDFVLSAKFPRSIVHGGEGARPDPDKVLVLDEIRGDLDLFLESMGRLGPKCGPLVMQFPYFNKTVFAGAGQFLERLDAFLEALPDGFRFAVEVRNKYWINGALLDLLRRHRTALVLVDLAYMPHPASLDNRFDLITADFSYARLIGDRKAVDKLTSTFDKIVVDHGERLDRWAELIRTHLERVSEVYVYANNHYAGHGPATVRDLVERIGPQ